MKRTLLKEIPSFLPESFLPYISGGVLYDSSCSPEARVIFSDKDCGYFIKTAPLGALKNEALMQNYFYKKGLSSRVAEYVSDHTENKDFMVTERVCGEDCTFKCISTSRLAFATFSARDFPLFILSIFRTVLLTTE